MAARIDCGRPTLDNCLVVGLCDDCPLAYFTNGVASLPLDNSVMILTTAGIVSIKHDRCHSISVMRETDLR